MSGDPVPSIDVSDAPELLRLAEEVRRSGKPHLLRSHTEDLALLVPVRRRGVGGRATATDAARREFLAAAGSWRDVDIDAFLAENQESRRRSTRPPAEL